MSAFWHSRGRRIALALAVALCLAFLALYIVVWVKSGEPDDAVPSDCLIVLGARTRGLTPSRSLRARLDRAKQAYDSGLAPFILVCGGRGEDESVSEAVAMAAYLEAQGVPADAILQESESNNTRENLRFAHRLMAQRGFRSAVLVTADYHMLRARMIAKQEGLVVTCLRAKSDWPGTWFSRVRECLSWIKYGLGLSNG